MPYLCFKQDGTQPTTTKILGLLSERLSIYLQSRQANIEGSDFFQDKLLIINGEAFSGF
jgi:hypothetical protein